MSNATEWAVIFAMEIGVDPMELEGDSDVKSREIKKTATMFYSIWQHNH